MADPSTVLVCTYCGAANAVPAGRGYSGGKCGRCGARLSPGAPVDIDGDTLAELMRRDRGAFVLDIWAPWCGPCRMMAPAFEAAAGRLADTVRFFKLNSDENQDAAGRLNIRGIPTLIAFRGGTSVARQPGALNQNDLDRWLSTSFSLSPHD